MTPELRKAIEEALAELTKEGDYHSVVEALAAKGFRDDNNVVPRSTTCPVARFLKARTGDESIWVASCLVGFKGDTTFMNLPTVVIRAVEFFDNQRFIDAL